MNSPSGSGKAQHPSRTIEWEAANSNLAVADKDGQREESFRAGGTIQGGL